MHGALQGGAMSTTYTASQGLLLMIPNMYKIAGELTATVFQVAARSLAAQGLSIFGDHSDVMAVRQTGFALLSSASVQEAHDFALIAQAATLRSRVPFMHFFDGFRTSHEVTTMERLEDDDLRALVSDDLVREHRQRALTPERPFIRGTAQNPDVYFQGRETVNPYYARVAGIVQEAMDALAERTGRAYGLVEYADTPRPPGSSSSWAPVVSPLARPSRRSSTPARRSACCTYGSTGRSRQPSSSPRCRPRWSGSPSSTGPRNPDPWASRCSSTSSPASARLTPTDSWRGCRASSAGATACPPRSSLRAWSPGSSPSWPPSPPGRGSPSASTTTSAASSLPYDPDLDIEDPATLRALFYGIGSDGTVGANKNTVKILAEDPKVHAQAYFVYDSKKSGGLTVSHLRFGPVPIAAPWLVAKAGFVGIHDFTLLDKVDILAHRPGRRDAAAQLAAPGGPGVGLAARAGAAGDHRPAAAAVRHRRRRRRS